MSSFVLLSIGLGVLSRLFDSFSKNCFMAGGGDIAKHEDGTVDVGSVPGEDEEFGDDAIDCGVLAFNI